MAKSKRSKMVNLTKTSKKGKELKQNLVGQIRECLDSYSTVYLFCVENMRTEVLQAARAELKGRARFFIGKNRVMAKALGSTVEEEQKEGLSQLAKRISGDVGLLFVREECPKGYVLKEDQGEGVISEVELTQYLTSLDKDDYARPGALSTMMVSVPAGPLMTRDGYPVPSNLEGQVRQCGLAVSLIRGVVVVPEGSERAICGEGDKLTADQARLLKILDYPMVTFRIRLMCRFRNGVVSNIAEEDDEQEN